MSRFCRNNHCCDFKILRVVFFGDDTYATLISIIEHCVTDIEIANTCILRMPINGRTKSTTIKF